MREIQISLKSIDDVKQFVQTLTMFDGEFELISGKYIVDATNIEAQAIENLINAKNNDVDTFVWKLAKKSDVISNEIEDDLNAK